MLLPIVSRIVGQVVPTHAEHFLCGDLNHLHSRRNIGLTLPQFFVFDFFHFYVKNRFVIID